MHQIILYLTTSLSLVLSYNILGIFQFPYKSNFIAFEPLLRNLAERGHNVTVLSHFQIHNPPKNYFEINVRESIERREDFEEIPRVYDLETLNGFYNFLNVLRIYKTSAKNCESFLNHPSVNHLYHTREKYDLILTEQFIGDCNLVFVHRFNCTHVAVTSRPMLSWQHRRMKSINNPSFIPGSFSGFSTKMNFVQRLENAIADLTHEVLHNTMAQMGEQKVLMKYFGSSAASIKDITRKTSLLLVNAYFPLSGVFPRSPNVIEVGGIHIKEFKLPVDLQQYIDESRDGVIYFSFGSMIKASSFSEQKLKAFQDAFAELPQRILWKWDNDTMPGKPENVMIRKWLPQFDILNHKNVKVFITHSGMLSTTEAVHCGVPLLCIPMFGDQFANAAAADESGLGTVLHFRDITKERVLTALRKVLDPKAQASAKRLSVVWRDRPLPPLETAVYWVEHVARHGGEHLRPASADLPLYRYLLLDVITFLFLVSFILAFVFYKLLVCLLSVIFSSKKKTKND